MVKKQPATFASKPTKSILKEVEQFKILGFVSDQLLKKFEKQAANKNVTDLELKRKERKRGVGKVRNCRLSFSLCLSHGRLLYILGNRRLCIAKAE
jgi:hypothetical protein